MATEAPAVSPLARLRGRTHRDARRRRTPNSSWRSQIQASADRIELELHLSDATTAPGSEDAAPDVDRAAIAAQISDSLDQARRLSHAPVNRWTLLRGWWTGEEYEQAWSRLHAANQALLTIQPDAAVRALVPDIHAAARAHLGRGDERLVAFEDWARRQRRNGTGPLSAEDRQVLKVTRQASEAASDQANVNLRGFRNVLLVSLLLLTLIVIGLAYGAVLRPGLFNLCAPSSAQTAGGSGGLCPSGDDKSSGEDVIHIEVLGAFGGAMAAVFTVSRMKGIGGPFASSSIQALLKLPAGAATALLGVLLLQNGMITGFSAQRSGVISAYAVIFGYAQQLVTRLVDRQAGNVQGPARSRNDPAKPAVDPGTTTVRSQAEE